MHPRRLAGFMLPLAAALVIACGGTGPGWSFAPLGPTTAPTVAPTAGPSVQPDVTIEVATPQSNAEQFEPDSLDAPANTVVQVNYLNDSSLQHNIVFLEGPDQTAPVLAETEIVIGPGNTQSVTFTTPTDPGDYYFYCVVHGDAMSGTLQVTAQ